MLCAPRQPLWASSYEKLFRVVELVDVENVVTRYPHDPISDNNITFRLF
jgi:hypothetical protein